MGKAKIFTMHYIHMYDYIANLNFVHIRLPSKVFKCQSYRARLILDRVGEECGFKRALWLSTSKSQAQFRVTRSQIIKNLEYQCIIAILLPRRPELLFTQHK